MVGLDPVLWILIVFNTDSNPDPALYLNADPDPDPRSQTKADQNPDHNPDPGEL
jgi:hypothetical protein